jgi:hypothetical protein
MGTLVGFVFGYVVGAKAGPEGYQKLRDAWEEILASDEWKGLVSTATAFVQNALARGGTALTEQMEATASGNGELGQAWRRITGDGDLMEAWTAISESGALQHLLSSGMELLGGVLEQGRAVLRETPPAGRAWDA